MDMRTQRLALIAMVLLAFTISLARHVPHSAAAIAAPTNAPSWRIHTFDGMPNGYNFIDVDGTLFFVQSAPFENNELWKSDGTPDGTHMLRSFTPDPSLWFGLSHLATLHGLLFFSARDPNSGRELWKSDGTEAGTWRVTDIAPGTRDAAPDGVTLIHGTLLFAADDGVHGNELWRSDGTAAGTALVADLLPGAASASPYWFIVSGATVVFVTRPNEAPDELWAIPCDTTATFAIPPVIGTAPGRAALLPIQYQITGLTAITSVTVTLTLDTGLTYLNDTSRITPTVTDRTLTWQLPGTPNLGSGFDVRLGTPTEQIGTRYPITLTLTLGQTDQVPVSTHTYPVVMLSYQRFLPAVRR